jgi:repressor LexA
MVLTKRQYEVLAFLDSFMRTNGYCPSFDEIGKNLNLSSLATVHKHLKTLEMKGYVRRGYNQSRSIEILNRIPLERGTQHGPKSWKPLQLAAEQPGNDLELPMLGRIAAGQPLEALNAQESLSLKEFVGNREVYVLKVRGNSMVEDHICDGDFVVVERTGTAKDGDTIVALIDNNEATLKRFYHEKDDRIRLQPANAAMEPIFVGEENLKIQGRVIGVLRKY